jgi:hypothetical protein
MTEAVVSSPQQSRDAAAGVDQLGQELAALIRQAHHQHTKEHTVLSQHHKYIRNHRAKPWRWIEAQDQAQEEKDKQPAASLGGEGQAQELN